MFGQGAGPATKAASVAVITGMIAGAPVRVGHEATQTRAAFSLQAPLDRYAAGEFAEAIQDVDGSLLTARDFIASAQAWIDAGDPAARRRREVVAAAFALEVVWTSTRRTIGARSPTFARDGDGDLTLLALHSGASSGLTDPDGGAALSVTAWGCQVMSRPGLITASERWWWLASVAVLEDGHLWRALSGGSTDDRSAARRELAGGHLAHARERVPDEPRWRLADLVVQEAINMTRGAGEGPGPAPLTRAHVLPDEPLPATARGRMSELEGEFAELARQPPLAGEAEVHLGYLAMRARRWDAALAHFDRARASTREPFLLVTASYLSGWIQEQLGHASEALAAYRRANALAPGQRNLSTRLAAQLFLSGERVEAYRILDDALKTPRPPEDVYDMFKRGDERLVPEYLAHLHEALR
jgi:tetratricopeptide (TPR) repeat protein